MGCVQNLSNSKKLKEIETVSIYSEFTLGYSRLSIKIESQSFGLFHKHLQKLAEALLLRSCMLLV